MNSIIDENDNDNLESRHRKELKAWEGEKRAALKKAKATKGKKAKELVARYVVRTIRILFGRRNYNCEGLNARPFYLTKIGAYLTLKIKMIPFKHVKQY